MKTDYIFFIKILKKPLPVAQLVASLQICSNQLYSSSSAILNNNDYANLWKHVTWFL